ncbi:MAG: hypothetical protein GY951_17155, partial [Psychromonas sp.]|nr:hypothetical protein [Psychromonas sp.]
GSATPNGAGTEPNSWNVGDWCIFSDVTPGAGTDLWQKIDNTSVISGAGTGQKVTKWAGAGPSETLTDGPITFSGNNSTFAGNVKAKLSNIAGLQNMFNIENATNTSVLASFGLNLSNDQLILGSDYAASFLLKTNGTTALTLDTSQNATFAGNVGIGATATDGNLQVKKTGISTGITDVLMNASFSEGSGSLKGLQIGYRTDETTAVLAARTATGNIAFYSYNGSWSESMRIKNNGNVGIGATSPDAKLSIKRASNAINTEISFIDGGNTRAAVIG